MRLLHTSDWHVGKSLRGRSRADEHRAVLAEIARLAAEHEADLALVAGDLFDSAAPSPEAEQIVYGALLELARAAREVLVVCGNHDNPRRLTALRPLLDLGNIHALPAVARPEQGGVRSFELPGGEDVHVALLPFVSQRGIVGAEELMAADAAEHSQEYAGRLKSVIGRLCEALPSDGVRLMVAHAMVHGGLLGGGERSAHTIFDYSIPVDAFAPSLQYVALGHLHRAQRLPGQLPVRYSGSPLQLDFGETTDAKSVSLVEVEPGRPARIEELPLTSGRPLRRVRGSLAQLEARADELREAWLRVELDERPGPGLADKVRELLPDAVDVSLVARDAAKPDGGPPRRLGRSPRELFAEYLEEKEARSEPLEALFAELLEELSATAET